MNEVRDICARMLEVPEPPLRGADEVLAIARRAKRRRDRLTTAAAGGLALAIVMGAAAVIGPDRVGETPNVVAGASAPPARAAASHGRTMTRVLLDAVAGEFTSTPERSFSDRDEVYPTAAPAGSPRIRILAAAVVRVYSTSGAGQLFAYLVHDGSAVPSGDVCAPELIGDVGPSASCEVRSVGGVPIRIVARTDDLRGQVFEATRFLDGGRLMVGAWQGVPIDPASGNDSAGWFVEMNPGRVVAWQLSPLATPLLDVARVAVIAADPAMLPLG